MGNSALLGRVYFHRLVIPVSIAISNLISFGISLAIFLVILAVYYFLARMSISPAGFFACRCSC